MFKYNIPDPSSLNVVADWVELFITFNKDSISKSELSSYIQASKGTEPEDDFLDSIWTVMRDRAILYGDDCPYNVEAKLISYNIEWEDYPEYLACLIYALEGNPNTVSTSASEAGKYFERISNEAVRNYLGGDSIIYGFPSELTVKEIAEDFLKERFNYTPPSYRKDRNLDLIAKRPFGDSRPSQMVLLVQCAAGENWKSKVNELNIVAWAKYINFASTPSKGFTVPVVISDNDRVNEISTDAGVLLDRPRLFRNTYKKTMLDVDLRNILKGWCTTRIAELNN